ncbi:hypothetical protein FRC04_000898 [Tulasnella sp. 424]|nr:hypothetical protein FRC04_000898 [Tulasnella sp. 424]
MKESISSSTRVSLANGTLIESSLSVEDEDEDESDGKDEVEVEDLKGELDSDDDDESKELVELMEVDLKRPVTTRNPSWSSTVTAAGSAVSSLNVASILVEELFGPKAWTAVGIPPYLGEESSEGAW